MSEQQSYEVRAEQRRGPFKIARVVVGKKAALEDVKWLRSRGWRVRISKMSVGR